MSEGDSNVNNDNTEAYTYYGTDGTEEESCICNDFFYDDEFMIPFDTNISGNDNIQKHNSQSSTKSMIESVELDALYYDSNPITAESNDALLDSSFYNFHQNLNSSLKSYQGSNGSVLSSKNLETLCSLYNDQNESILSSQPKFKFDWMETKQKYMLLFDKNILSTSSSSNWSLNESAVIYPRSLLKRWSFLKGYGPVTPDGRQYESPHCISHTLPVTNTEKKQNRRAKKGTLKRLFTDWVSVSAPSGCKLEDNKVQSMVFSDHVPQNNHCDFTGKKLQKSRINNLRWNKVNVNKVWNANNCYKLQGMNNTIKTTSPNKTSFCKIFEKEKYLSNCKNDITKRCITTENSNSTFSQNDKLSSVKSNSIADSTVSKYDHYTFNDSYSCTDESSSSYSNTNNALVQTSLAECFMCKQYKLKADKAVQALSDKPFYQPLSSLLLRLPNLPKSSQCGQEARDRLSHNLFNSSYTLPNLNFLNNLTITTSEILRATASIPNLHLNPAKSSQTSKIMSFHKNISKKTKYMKQDSTSINNSLSSSGIDAGYSSWESKLHKIAYLFNDVPLDLFSQLPEWLLHRLLKLELNVCCVCQKNKVSLQKQDTTTFIENSNPASQTHEGESKMKNVIFDMRSLRQKTSNKGIFVYS